MGSCAIRRTGVEAGVSASPRCCLFERQVVDFHLVAGVAAAGSGIAAAIGGVAALTAAGGGAIAPIVVSAAALAWLTRGEHEHGLRDHFGHIVLDALVV